MQKKAAVEMVVGMGLCQRRRVCRVWGVNRSTLYCKRQESARKLAEEGVVEQVSRDWPCLEFEKVTRLLRRDHGLKINPKRVRRIRG